MPAQLLAKEIRAVTAPEPPSSSHSPAVLILRDELGCAAGRSLLLHVAERVAGANASRASRAGWGGPSVVLLALEQRPARYRRMLGAAAGDVCVCDAFSARASGERDLLHCDLAELPARLLRVCAEAAPKPAEGRPRVVLLVDSLTPLLREHGAHGVCLALHALRARGAADGSQVLLVGAVLHADAHDATTLAAVERSGSTTVRLEAALARETLAWAHGRAVASRLRSSGHVTIEEEYFTLSAGRYAAVDAGALPEQGKVGGSAMAAIGLRTGEAAELAAMESAIPFSMQLSDQERAARDAVVLPYVHDDAAIARKAYVDGAIPTDKGVLGAIYVDPNEEAGNEDDEDEEGDFDDPDGDLDV